MDDSSKCSFEELSEEISVGRGLDYRKNRSRANLLILSDDFPFDVVLWKSSLKLIRKQKQVYFIICLFKNE